MNSDTWYSLPQPPFSFSFTPSSTQSRSLFQISLVTSAILWSCCWPIFTFVVLLLFEKLAWFVHFCFISDVLVRWPIEKGYLGDSHSNASSSSSFLSFRYSIISISISFISWTSPDKVHSNNLAARGRVTLMHFLGPGITFPGSLPLRPSITIRLTILHIEVYIIINDVLQTIRNKSVKSSIKMPAATKFYTEFPFSFHVRRINSVYFAS